MGSEVDWNSAVASRILGIALFRNTYLYAVYHYAVFARENTDQHNDIGHLKQLSTLQPGYLSTPFDSPLRVRCDDPGKICVTDLYAYVHTDEEEEYANFCPLYFEKPMLRDTIENMKRGGTDGEKQNIDTYFDTQGTAAQATSRAS